MQLRDTLTYSGLLPRLSHAIRRRRRVRLNCDDATSLRRAMQMSNAR